MAARIGAMLAAPFVWVGATTLFLARTLVHALLRVTGLDRSPRKKAAPSSAEVRIQPYIRLPFAKRLFGNGIPLSWLVHVRLFGAGYATYNADGSLQQADDAGARIQDNGKARLTGQVRLFGIPVYRTESLELMKFPFGSHILNKRPERVVAQARAASDVTMTQWMHYADQLIDGVEASLQPAPRAVGDSTGVDISRPIDLNGYAGVSTGLQVSRPMAPVHLSVSRNTTTRGWDFSLDNLALDVTQHDAETRDAKARAEFYGSLTGQWQRTEDGIATYNSNLRATGGINLFGTANASEPLASGQLQLLMGGRSSNPLVHGQWLWTSGQQGQRSLLDAVGVSEQTALLLPESITFHLK